MIKCLFSNKFVSFILIYHFWEKLVRKGVGFTALSKKAAPPTRPRMERGKEWKEVEVTVIKGQ